MITQKIKNMMREVDTHISKKERIKAMSKIEDIVEEFNKVKQEQMTKAKQEKKICGRVETDAPSDTHRKGRCDDPSEMQIRVRAAWLEVWS